MAWGRGRSHRRVGRLEDPGPVGLLLGADHMDDGVDQRQVGKRLREVAQMASGAWLDFLGIQL